MLYQNAVQFMNPDVSMFDDYFRFSPRNSFHSETRVVLYARRYLPFAPLLPYSRNDYARVEIHLIAHCKAILPVKVAGNHVRRSPTDELRRGR